MTGPVGVKKPSFGSISTAMGMCWGCASDHASRSRRQSVKRGHCDPSSMASMCNALKPGVPIGGKRSPAGSVNTSNSNCRKPRSSWSARGGCVNASRYAVGLTVMYESMTSGACSMWKLLCEPLTWKWLSRSGSTGAASIPTGAGTRLTATTTARRTVHHHHRLMRTPLTLDATRWCRSASRCANHRVSTAANVLDLRCHRSTGWKRGMGRPALLV